MTYSDFTIEQIREQLVAKALKKGTPKKYAGDLYEAAEVIQQLQKRIAALEAEKEEPYGEQKD